MKTEMFYGRDWKTMEQVEQAIARYMRFYNEDRIKTSLGGITIREHRVKGWAGQT